MQLTEANGAISKVDTSVIVLGKCLEFYSRCYPNVTRDGRLVTIKEAVESMQHIVNELAAMELPSRVHEDHAKVRQLRLLEEQTAYEDRIIPTSSRKKIGSGFHCWSDWSKNAT